MANPTRPWFPFYARDWLTDDKVMLMSLEAQGAYVRLLAVQWENGRIPQDPEEAAALVGLTSVKAVRRFVGDLWPVLAPHFPSYKRRFRRNRRLARLADHACHVGQSRTKSGRKGGLQTAKRARLGKQKFSDADADADDEEPLTPRSGGSFSLRSEKKNPRARGTNPRARGTNPRRVEQEKRDRLVDALRRHADREVAGAVIEAHGIYDRQRGMLTWDRVPTARLEKILEELGS